jgi:hypothetical protein
MSKDLNEPDLDDILDGALDDLIYSFNCHRVGIIESFNAMTQLATVKLVDKGVITTNEGSQIIEYAPLVDCPVIINKGINGGLTIPINKGDACIVHFNDRNLDGWLVNGLIQRPKTLRAHDFSDAIVEIGVRSQVNKIMNYNNNATELNYLDNNIYLDISKIGLINSQGASIVLDDKLELKNTAENLKDLIDELITIVTNLKTVDPISGDLPIDLATANNLTALSARVGDLLK